MRIIDLFAGAGGFSTGATQAGTTVLCAANHWRAAIDVHRRNHPQTDHRCQDLSQADFCTFPPHDVLLASPACQGHSRARGTDRPHHDACRSTAWAVIACAEVHRPHFVLVENVPEFTRWLLYPAWKHALTALGYSITENVLDAADFGVPQHRRRVFVLAVRGRTGLALEAPKYPHEPAINIIRWNEGRWSPIQNGGERDTGEDQTGCVSGTWRCPTVRY